MTTPTIAQATPDKQRLADARDLLATLEANRKRYPELAVMLAASITSLRWEIQRAQGKARDAVLKVLGHGEELTVEEIAGDIGASEAEAALLVAELGAQGLVERREVVRGRRCVRVIIVYSLRRAA